MTVAGLGYAVFYPVLVISATPGWVWGEPHRMPAFEHMLFAIYVPLGFFLVWGARDPLRYRPLVDYVIASNLLHATAMLLSASADHSEHEHLLAWGDVAGTYAGAIVLLAGHPTHGIASYLRRRRTSTSAG
ncbi:hypothetical protein OG462_43865 [Streptomyces sp. NBC_01077]|uniref:DUF6632 domain-containing protein n=1 Tax=Streptomyces sp. NBC_01077 TaxID=2903746 RepID=UPI00386E1259|nr:hypothetical protein OG462_01140 [Streptomyces sp. NBC_01077]WSV43680.1 hypothetical protein OG462_43865 [Streptomyces sp. NBC_01077]